jgi:Ca2+-binding RTX toxin-like protein
MSNAGLLFLLVVTALLLASGVALAATIECRTEPGTNLCVGTPDNDRLFGTATSDLMKGRGGSDVLRAEEGSDELRGTAGSDILYGRTPARIPCTVGKVLTDSWEMRQRRAEGRGRP